MRILIAVLVLLAISLSAKFMVFEDGRWYDYSNFSNYQLAQEEVIATNEADIRDLEIVTNGLARERDKSRAQETEAIRKGRISWITGFLCGLLPSIAFMLGVAVGGK